MLVAGSSQYSPDAIIAAIFSVSIIEVVSGGSGADGWRPTKGGPRGGDVLGRLRVGCRSLTCRERSNLADGAITPLRRSGGPVKTWVFWSLQVTESAAKPCKGSKTSPANSSPCGLPRRWNSCVRKATGGATSLSGARCWRRRVGLRHPQTCASCTSSTGLMTPKRPGALDCAKAAKPSSRRTSGLTQSRF